MVPKSVGAQLKNIAKAWQYDPLHPNYQLSTFLDSLASHPNLTKETVKAAQALKDDAAKKKWPINSKLITPASMPHYYTRLLDGVERSKKGIGRPWWKVFFGVW